MDKFTPRIPQKEAFDAFYDYYSAGGSGNPLIAMQTGLGKSYAIAMILIKKIKQTDENILVVTHSEKVLTQDYNALYDLLCYYNIFCSIGKYSAKLGVKEVGKRVTFATIGSIFKHADKFPVDYLIVDEAHLISHDEDTMYRKLINALDVPVCGLTATPFRTGKGYLHEMEDRIFTDLIYNTNTPEKFAQMIELGYLAKPTTKSTAVKMNVDGVTKTAGDFNLKGLSKKLDRDELTDAIISDLVNYKDDYKHIMIFAIDIKHSENIARAMNKVGIVTGFVHSKSEEDNDEAIKAFREGKIQALVSVMMLTTGVDIPTIDLVVCMRPTSSPVIHVQSIGRGLRVCEGKTTCLILDYAGNTRRNGPIDDPLIKVKKKGIKTGEAIVKECPDCQTLHHISVRVCECGHEFEFKQKLEVTSSEHSIIKEKRKEWLSVNNVYYFLHKKPGKPDSLRVEYLCGLRKFPIWLTVYHGGYSSRNSNHILNMLKKEPFEYSDIQGIISNKDKLKVPSEILVDVTERYPYIEDFKFEESQ